MDPLAIAGVAGLLLVKEAGVPVPVPGDLVVIGAGAAVAGEPGAAALTLALILVFGWVGGGLQFLVMRRALRDLVLRTLSRLGVPRSRIDALAARIGRGGARGVAVARMTPGVRVGAIAASGLSAIGAGPFARGLAIGNAVFVGAHFVLGYALGASIGTIIAAAGSLAFVAIVAVLVLAVLGAAGWLAVRKLRGPSGASAPLAGWTDAACPACLAVVAMRGHIPLIDE